MGRGPTETKRRTVLVVEDDADLLATYEVWLAAWDDVTVRSEVDGQAALTAVDDADVLVLDRKLPGLSGPEVLDRLGADRPAVVVVSAYQPDAHVREGDVDAYLVKPVTRERFLDAVRGTLP